MKPKGHKFRILLSWLVLVAAPVMVVGYYYFAIAADQYATITRFAVRSTDASDLAAGLLSKFTRSLAGGYSNDTYIIKEYIHSRELIQRLDREIGIREIYSKRPHDFYASIDKTISLERLREYWKRMVNVSLDRVSEIFTVKVYAFTAEDAQKVASAILSESERMINAITRKAREDALTYAKSEVAKAEARLKEINKKLLTFRTSTQEIDPAKKAQIQVLLIGKLNEKLATLQAKLRENESYLSKSAPTIINLRNQIKALKIQIEKEKQKLGGNRKRLNALGADDPGLSSTLSEYENLLIERGFAEKIYVTALTALEQARIMANRQQRYLAVFVRPFKPDEALYPKRLRNTFITFIALQLVWALGMLIVQSIYDRL